MRAAPPPIVHNLAGSGPWVAAAMAVAAVSSATPFLWLAWHLSARRLGGAVEDAMLGLLLLMAVVLSVGLARRAARRHRGEQIRWDGGRWQLLDAKGHAWSIGTPAVALDVGDWMLLRARRELDGARVWLPAQRSDRPGTWHGLRVALSHPVAASPSPVVPAGVDP